MRLPLHEYILTVGVSIALTLLIARLLISRLARVYKFFFCYLTVDVLDTVYPFFIPFGEVYGWVYFSLQWIKLCAYVLVVFELYSILLTDLRGIAQLARRYSMVALGIAVLLSVLVVTALPLPPRLLRKLFYVEIPLISSLILFMLLIAAFLAYYPVPLHRNALVYAIGYVVYFVSKTVLLFVINLHPRASVRGFSTALLYVELVCVAFWAVSLNRAGERRVLSVGSKWSPLERQQQVLLRLRELNDSLIEARPK